jgi:hypothetical protein
MPMKISRYGNFWFSAFACVFFQNHLIVDQSLRSYSADTQVEVDPKFQVGGMFLGSYVWVQSSIKALEVILQVIAQVAVGLKFQVGVMPLGPYKCIPKSSGQQP